MTTPRLKVNGWDKTAWGVIKLLLKRVNSGAQGKSVIEHQNPRFLPRGGAKACAPTRNAHFFDAGGLQTPFTAGFQREVALPSETLSP
jgi:hypothetical protein